jgi:hypothetical protein
MLRILFIVQCDVCGDFFEQLHFGTTARQNDCALRAGSIIETASMEGWFFNEKTRQFWCVDCVLALAGNENMPHVSDFTLPLSIKRGTINEAIDDDSEL